MHLVDLDEENKKRVMSNRAPEVSPGNAVPILRKEQYEQDKKYTACHYYYHVPPKSSSDFFFIYPAMSFSIVCLSIASFIRRIAFEHISSVTSFRKYFI